MFAYPNISSFMLGLHKERQAILNYSLFYWFYENSSFKLR